MAVQLDPAAARRVAGELREVEQALGAGVDAGPLGLSGAAAEVDAALGVLDRAAALALVGAMVLAGCARGAQEATVTEHEVTEHEVTIPLGEPPAAVSGHEWPTRDDGSHLDATAVEQEHTLVLQLEGEEVLRSSSQLTFLRESGGTVPRAVLTPLPELLPLAAAVDEIEALLARNGLLTDAAATELAGFADHRPDDPEWPDSGDRLATRAASTDELSVFVELRQREPDGWSVSMTVGLPLDADDTA